MAGIEEAFEKFVTRVSSGEEPQSEYGDPQTGEKRIPIMQGIKRGYDFENTMPNYYNQRYNYENEMPIYKDERYSIPQQELAYGGRAGYRNAGSVEPFYINEMTDKISDPTIGGIAGMLPSEVVGGATGLLAAKAAKGLVDTTVKLTKKEKSYLKELMSDTGGGKFTAEILEEAPSLKISGDKLIVKQKDLQNLDKFLKDLRISEQAPSGVGANTIPPRLRDFSTDNNVVRQLYRNTPGYTGYSDGGRVSMSDGGLTTTVPPDKGPDSQGVESLFRRRYS